MATHSPRLRRAIGTMFGSLSIAVTALPSLAAERVVFSYGLLEIPVSVDSLEAFAQAGRVDTNLAFFLRRLSSEERERIREVLSSPLDLSHVTLSQILYSSSGDVLLQYLGDLIQTDSRLSGFYALRSAIVLAAADSEGLTVLNVLHQFPAQTVHVDGSRALQIAKARTQLLEQTDQMIARIHQQAEIEVASLAAIDFTQLPDLRQPGSFNWQMEALKLYDRRRDRVFEADLYYPQLQSSASLPVVVISHGLGANRNSFADIARHLASHGFAAVTLEHPGSNTRHLQNLLEERSSLVSEVVAPGEFIDVPRDVSFLLDELERRNQTSSSHISFNLERVGVIGHSFGGYAALALAGAELNFEQIQTNCIFSKNTLNLVNVSLLLQCIASQGQNRHHMPLRDDRVQAVFTMNPIISTVFGSSGLQQVQVPTMMVAGSNDLLAPALLEQIRPFTWLEGSDNYLVLIDGGAHIYADSSSSVPEILATPALTGPNPALARQYLRASSLAFMKTYIAAQDEYRVYLNASYYQTISQPPLELTLVRTLSTISASLME